MAISTRLIGLALAMSGLVASCGGQPRTDEFRPKPERAPSPRLAKPMTWVQAELPPTLTDGAMLNGAAASRGEYIIVGQSDGLVAEGIVLRSQTGVKWEAITDPVARLWSLHTIVATDRGVVAGGGQFGEARKDGSVEWSAGLLFSPDGRTWSLTARVASADIRSIASSGSSVTAFTDGTEMLVSADGGRTFTNAPTAAAGFQRGVPLTATVLGNGTWVALGKSGHSAAAWRSTDGIRWEPAVMDQPGVPDEAMSMSPYGVAQGPAGAVAVATAESSSCEIDEDDPTCARRGAAWLTQDGSSWERLGPNSVLSRQWGHRLWSAGSWGIVTNETGLQRSLTGQDWSAVAGTDSMLVDMFLRSGNGILIGGYALVGGPDAPTRTVWVGTAAEP